MLAEKVRNTAQKVKETWKGAESRLNAEAIRQKKGISELVQRLAEKIPITDEIANTSLQAKREMIPKLVILPFLPRGN